MIVHLDKEQTRQMRRKLLADNSDIVFILFHDILKELHKKGETQPLPFTSISITDLVRL